MSMTATPASPFRSDDAPEIADPAETTAASAADATASSGRLRRFLRGRPTDPAWARPALFVLLGVTAFLYLWSLSESGWANDFYAAAVQAGSQSWKAFFFGSSDAMNSITVDKPPASLWPMVLSVRIFGLSSWSLLVPQALMGVGSVGVTYAAVKRYFGAAAGLLAGTALALTPVAALMFRYDNPDALLVLLLTVSAYTALRAIEDGRTRWFVLTGVAVGLGFLTKQLQAFLVVPGFALAALVAGAGSLWTRIRGLLVAGVALVLSAGWWVAAVELWPASSRPWIGGSETDSFLELTLGYNGLGRIFGQEGSGGGGAGGPGSAFSASRGIGRMFGTAIGGQISWLIPLTLLSLVAGLVVLWRRPRVDLQRASLIVWGGWLLVTGITFSFMSGIFHEYYTVALAPAVAALFGIGATLWWQRRTRWWATALAAVGVGMSTWWATVLLGRAADWNAWLRPTVAVAGGLTTLVLLGVAAASALGRTAPRWLVAGAATLALAAVLAGPAAWTAQTVSTAHNGPIVTAGPTVAGGLGGGPGGGAPGGADGAPPQMANGQMPSPADGGGFPSPPTGDGATQDGASTQGGPGGLSGSNGGFPGMGGVATPSDELVETLSEDAEDYDWVAATVGSSVAAPYQLATDEPVLPIGGFNGSDPSPTLEEFQALVEDGRIHWFIASSGGPDGGGGFGGTSDDISTWVTENFTEVTVDGVTLYDLTVPSAG